MGTRYRIWWIPQVPMHAFFREVDSLQTAKVICDVLADYDLFQLENRIKPDYSNAGGIEELIDGEWHEVDEDGEVA